MSSLLTASRSVAALTADNGREFFDNFSGLAKIHGLWDYYTGIEVAPEPSDPDNPTSAERKELKAYRRERDQAAGLLWHCISDDQRNHISEDPLKSDPYQAFTKLLSIHKQKKPSHRFTAYDQLFSIEQREDETCASVIARVGKAMQEVKALRPASADRDGKIYTLSELDQELELMAALRSLGPQYATFISSLFLLDDLTLEKARVAFQNEDTNRKNQVEKVNAAAAAAALFSSPPPSSPTLSPSSQSPTSSRSPSPSPSASTICNWCQFKGHLEADCRKKERARQAARSRSPKKQNANSTEETATEEQPAT